MSDTREKMDKAIEALKHNFTKVRTGRAITALPLRSRRSPL